MACELLSAWTDLLPLIYLTSNAHLWGTGVNPFVEMLVSDVSIVK